MRTGQASRIATTRISRSTVVMVVTAVGIMLVAANLRPPVVSVGPLVDDIQRATGFGGAATGMLTTLPVLFFGLSAPIAPRIATRIGIERTIFASLVVLIAAMAVRLVPAPVALFAGSAGVGAAIGVCNVVLPALIKRDFARHSGLMTGLYSMTLSGGAAIAAGLTVPIDDAVGGNWRLTLASWSLLALVAVAVWLPQLARASRLRTAATAGHLWRDPIAWAITVFMGAQSLVFYTIAAWLPRYLMDEQGMSRSEAGTLLAIGQVAALIMSLIAPIVAVRFRDQRPVTLAVLGLCAVGFAGLVVGVGPTAVWVICVMAGPGASISLALLFMVLRTSSTAQTGRVSGMAQSVGYVIAAIGPMAFGAVHDLTGSWTVAMTVLALALVPQALATRAAGRDVVMRHP